MAFTDHCDVFSRLNESAFNSVVNSFMRQRPATFNYATQRLIDIDEKCKKVIVHPDLLDKDIDLWTVLDPIAIPGAPAGQGVHYCVQLRELKIDFTPSNVIVIPPELGNTLDPQEIALSAVVCGGIACNQGFRMRDIDLIDRELRKVKKHPLGGVVRIPALQRLRLHCFCLKLVATVKVLRDNTHIRLDVTGLELVDIKPEGLENSLECFMIQILDSAVLPKLKIALSDLIFDVDGLFSVTPTPVSGNVPFNPDISNNNLSVFINLN